MKPSKKRPPGRPRNPEGSRTEVVKVSLHPDELKRIMKVTDTPAAFMREAALAKADASKGGKKK